MIEIKVDKPYAAGPRTRQWDLSHHREQLVQHDQETLIIDNE